MSVYVRVIRQFHGHPESAYRDLYLIAVPAPGAQLSGVGPRLARLEAVTFAPIWGGAAGWGRPWVTLVLEPMVGDTLAIAQAEGWTERLTGAS